MVCHKAIDHNLLLGGTIMKRIQTHQFIDMDAVASAWLVKRFIFNGDAEIVFDRHAEGRFDAVVDVGGVYDPYFLRFDHHIAGMENQSATMLVLDSLPPSIGVALLPLVQIIHDADLGHNTQQVQSSKICGIHAFLDMLKKDHTDAEAYAKLESMLDGIADRLIADREAEAWVAEQSTHWLRLDDDQYLKYQIHIDAPKGATQAAYRLGVNLVAFYNPNGDLSRGMVRRNDCTLHIGDVVANTPNEYIGAMFEHFRTSDIINIATSELVGWYKHPAGFMAGKTPKGGTLHPLDLTAEDFRWLIHIILEQVQA